MQIQQGLYEVLGLNPGNWYQAKLAPLNRSRPLRLLSLQRPLAICDSMMVFLNPSHRNAVLTGHSVCLASTLPGDEPALAGNPDKCELFAPRRRKSIQIAPLSDMGECKAYLLKFPVHYHG
jgi:hypothetical protein